MKRFAAILLAMMLGTASCALADGVVVEANEASATGYTATFSYKNEDAAKVQIMGGFTFYNVGDTYVLANGRLNADGKIVEEGHKINPEAWEPGMARFGDSGYVADMVKGEDGMWTISVDLPGGSYLYQYVVTDAQGNSETITDPANIPVVNELGANQARSKFYVPYDAEKQAEADDWTFVTPIEDESKRGQIEWANLSNGELNYEFMIYTPAGFDRNREEPYKVLYLCHGGGGEEGDWFHQGNAQNVIDRMIADGAVEPFIIVSPDTTNSDTMMDVLIPYMEENYNASTEVAGRAFAGLSRGGTLTYQMYQSSADQYGYFGVFSGSYPAATTSILDAKGLNQPKLYLACGFADQAFGFAMNAGQLPMAPYSHYLTSVGVEYVGLDMVEGGHDWFTWPQTLKLFVEKVLWK